MVTAEAEHETAEHQMKTAEAGSVRLRPILMTTLTTIFGIYVIAEDLKRIRKKH